MSATEHTARVPLSMRARALLRQSLCPECKRVGHAAAGADCDWCVERQGVIQELLSDETTVDPGFEIAQQLADDPRNQR